MSKLIKNADAFLEDRINDVVAKEKQIFSDFKFGKEIAEAIFKYINRDKKDFSIDDYDFEEIKYTDKMLVTYVSRPEYAYYDAKRYTQRRFFNLVPLGKDAIMAVDYSPILLEKGEKEKGYNSPYSIPLTIAGANAKFYLIHKKEGIYDLGEEKLTHKYPELGERMVTEGYSIFTKSAFFDTADNTLYIVTQFNDHKDFNPYYINLAAKFKRKEDGEFENMSYTYTFR